MRALAISLALFGAAAGPAAAQPHVADVEGGLHWSVAAPQGARWSLVCRFAPVTYVASTFEQNRWTNKIATTGTGAARGRLPQQDGRCTVTKTGGPGPVGVALVRGEEIQAAGTNDPARPAAVGFL